MGHRQTATKHLSDAPDGALSAAIVALRAMSLHRDCVGGLICSRGEQGKTRHDSAAPTALKSNNGRTSTHQVLEAYDA
eukprot:7380905-Pyramimonas_sp.AAC.1